MYLPVALTIASLTLALEGCQDIALLSRQSLPQTSSQPPSAVESTAPAPVTVASVAPADRQTLLQQSWAAYRQRFIQADGRVIDREADDRSTSEGQAYAMLRAVIVGDRDTFDRTLQWAENNLQRQTNGKRSDHLWAWKWGRNSQGAWGILDSNFASDADIDAVTALIFAARRWQDSAYLDLARTKLNDLWNLSTVTAFPTSVQANDRRKPRPGKPFTPGPSPP
ncbi:glycosyl hydrolase family 8 [Leptothermofonsia sp. ETS-13]|uniref:glycosyl hydrolase family 8 n=1 Tax=Leptothermofonsia sp. ETS-13 TaxID=3035696 RepID=UPI003BA338E4